MAINCKYIIPIVLLALIACNAKDNGGRRLVGEWVGREIVIPDDLQFQILDTRLAPELDSSEFKVVNYVDSSGCTSCRMKLQAWDETIDEFKALPGVDVEVLTIVDTNDAGEIALLTDRYNYRHLIAVDTAGVFNRANALPERTECHTFLLDSGNRILAIGNPVTNPKIKELYRRVILDGGATDNENRPAQFMARTLGAVQGGDTASVTFPIRNDGETTLHVQSVIPSCDCTTAAAAATELQPRAASIVTVTYVADGEPGPFSRYVDIFYKEKENPDRLIVYGYITNH